ncbi:MAG: hypothetical protein MZU97_20050 [Bacillus subtilis]|nr:hypothetical protein [Bacillus subtilis]
MVSSRAWQNTSVGDENGAYEIYLTAGEHTLTLRSTTAHYTASIDRLNAIMDDINQISLKVQTITGGNTDDALDWNILKYIPDLKERLIGYAAELEAMYDALDAFDDSQPSAPEPRR